MLVKNIKLLSFSLVLLTGSVFAGNAEPGEEIISQVLKLGVSPAKHAPNSGKEREGPFKRLVIKNASVINGTGAPLQRMTIIIEDDRIVSLQGGGTGSLHIGEQGFDTDTKVIDATGKYVLPGFIDAHVHFGTPSHAFGGSLTDPEYVGKLMLAHGITTVRDAGSIMGLNWTLDHKKRSENGEISAPRIIAHAMFPESMKSPEAAREWVRAVREKGADGIKLIGAAPELIKAVINEAKKLNMKTAYHHSQVSVTQTNVLDSARMGLDSMEHWYGLPEAMFEDRRIQHYPSEYDYNNEQDRFREAGKLWRQAAAPGSEKWQATINELISLDFTIDPTFTIYEANRDVTRSRTAEWYAEYTMPYIDRAFEPNPKIHGSYHFDWTTADEVAWKNNFKLWMTFINDYKNAGGRVTTGSDPGFIYSVYGFSYVRELELLQEAGFHPLEVLQSATINGAQLLGLDADIGSIEIGKKADLVIVDENPLANFKVLYGTGHRRFNAGKNKMERTNGIRYTIKDGIVYDAKQLLADVRKLVVAQKNKEAAAQ